MWFKNAQIYRLPEAWAISFERLDYELARGVFRGCPSNQPRARGWVQPRQDSGLAYVQNGQWLIALCVEERLLPNDVVRREVASLTPTQLKVLLAVLEGQLNKQIAHTLGIAEATVKAHMTAIMRKLDVKNRTQAALVARSLGLDLKH